MTFHLGKKAYNKHSESITVMKVLQEKDMQGAVRIRRQN